MTICCGWLTNSSAYVVADSVLTQKDTTGAVVGARVDTSFGEATISGPGKAIYEGAIKVVRLADDCVAAVTGDLPSATAAMSALRYQLIGGASIPGALVAEKDRVTGFRLLVAGHEDGGPRLWQLSERHVKEYYEPG